MKIWIAYETQHKQNKYQGGIEIQSDDNSLVKDPVKLKQTFDYLFKQVRDNVDYEKKKRDNDNNNEGTNRQERVND